MASVVVGNESGLDSLSVVLLNNIHFKYSCEMTFNHVHAICFHRGSIPMGRRCIEVVILCKWPTHHLPGSLMCPLCSTDTLFLVIYLKELHCGLVKCHKRSFCTNRYFSGTFPGHLNKVKCVHVLMCLPSVGHLVESLI